MIKETAFFNNYKVLEIKRNGMYDYYLEKIGYGNLFSLYSTLEECFPAHVDVLKYIKTAESKEFWGK